MTIEYAGSRIAHSLERVFQQSAIVSFNWRSSENLTGSDTRTLPARQSIHLEEEPKRHISRKGRKWISKLRSRKTLAHGCGVMRESAGRMRLVKSGRWDLPSHSYCYTGRCIIIGIRARCVLGLGRTVSSREGEIQVTAQKIS